MKHYPFHEYKLVEIPANTKKKLNIKQIKTIRDLALPSGGRLELARDFFMLSFYLCGMNAVDMYRIPPVDNPTRRIDYNRSKTKNRRKDRAFISVGIPKDAMDLYNQYAGKLQNRYASHISSYISRSSTEYWHACNWKRIENFLSRVLCCQACVLGIWPEINVDFQKMMSLWL